MPAILYTIGYGNRQPRDVFALIPPGAGIIDVRRDPRGWHQSYTARAMKTTFGARYRSIPALGNLSTDPAVWIPVNPAAARQHIQLLAHAVTDKPHVLLCAESDHQKCHRRFIAEQIAALAPGLEIVHL